MTACEPEQLWYIGDRCHAPKDTHELIIVDFLGDEAELQPATGLAGPRRWCKTSLLTPTDDTPPSPRMDTPQLRDGLL